MLSNIFKKNYIFLLGLICLSIFSILPFLNPGFFTFHDNVQVARVFAMFSSLSEGMFPVRWVSDLGYGFGYPIFNFYSVLPYYFAGFIASLGIDVLTATKITFVTVILLSGVSMYLFVNSIFGKLPGLVAAVIYLYFPYHAVNVFVRGDLAEAAAYAFLPLVFMSFYKIYELVSKDKPSGLYVVIGSLSIAAVILSHNLTAFMLFIFIGLFCVGSLIVSSKRKKLLLPFAVTLVVAFLLSAFYSLPAVNEMGYTNVLSQIGGGSHYADHFVCPEQLWNSAWGFGGSVPGCLDGLSFKLGKLNIILASLSLLVFLYSFRNRDERSYLNAISFISFLVAVFLVLPYSIFVWDLPYMDFLQFPWRFINFIGVFISFSVGYLMYVISKRLGSRALFTVSVAVILGTLFFNAKLFEPQEQLRDVRAQDYTNATYLRFTASKISDEYLPRGFIKPENPDEQRTERFELVDSEGSVKVAESRVNYASAIVESSTSAHVRANIAYFPAWRAFVDGKKEGYIVKNDGIYIKIPEGKHKVEAKYVETSIESIGDKLTLVGVIALFLVIINNLRLSYGKKTT